MSRLSKDFESISLAELRKKTNNARGRVLKMSYSAKSAHAGSALSCLEILMSLFAKKYQNDSPLKKIILSKGHAAMGLYATAEQFGLISPEDLDVYLQNGSKLWGHPSKSESFNWIDWSTGSLGHGLPAAVGMAYAGKIKSSKQIALTQSIAVILSDGECDEGSNWEAALFAGHHNLSNITVFVDYNKIQSLDFVENVLSLEPLAKKWESFRWDCIEIDGHSLEDLNAVWDRASTSNKPLCVICHTTKGKGVPDIENTIISHYRPISKIQLETFENEK